MTSHVDSLIATNERLLAACREARLALAHAYGCAEPRTVAAVEVPTAAWKRARDRAERVHGRRIWKYFTEGANER